MVLNMLKLVERVVDDRAWRAETLGDRAAWYHTLHEELLSSLRGCLFRSAREPRTVSDLKLSEQDRAQFSHYLAPVRQVLERGRGFVILDRLPVERLSLVELTAMYWLIGQLLGQPIEQNIEGTLLYDVRDTGRDLAVGARFSVTNYESSFHTDNSFGDAILDYVGLLCVQPAKQGGLSQNVSGYTAHNVLLREHPEALETLYRELHVDRRGGFREGESPTVPRPVFARHDSGLLIRYLRYWIEVGHEKVGQPLTTAQRQALDAFDGVLQRPELRAEFELKPGQIYFINNRWILHNRTAFTDYPEPERRRHLVRLWLRTLDER